ncbi:MAG: tRNA (adenosine(37)-N6)-dimethylallyltransferase MiaA [Actinomycetales bacterium]
MTEPVLAIVGPTASGKTALAVDLAEQLGGQIVGTDSMQAYQGMVIGTAAPAGAELHGVVHHMLQVWPINHAVTVMEFQQRARSVIADVQQRAMPVIVVGGSGLYVSAVLDDLSFPPTDPAVRATYEQQLQQVGPAALHERLRAIDPEAAAAIDPGNGRRIVRALEVNRLTNAPFRARLPKPTTVVPAIRVGLRIDRVSLDARIAARVEWMWESGFVAEVQGLLDAGLAEAVTASRALGYHQICQALAGECSMQEAKAATIEATRRFARRQQRWFARDDRITWFDYDAPDLADSVLRLLAGTST